MQNWLKQVVYFFPTTFPHKQTVVTQPIVFRPSEGHHQWYSSHMWFNDLMFI